MLFALSTTGAVQWQSFLIDPSQERSPAVALTSEKRGRLRAALKQCKRADEQQREWSTISSVAEEYLPCLCGVLTCLENDALLLKHEPSFSWRASLSASKLKSPPRVAMPSLHYEIVFVLLTMALAQANAASGLVQSLGDYERLRHTSEAERKRLDERVNVAADTLCRAAGILAFLSEQGIPRWEMAVSGFSTKSRPAEATREMTAALSKICMADAERLAIRRLLTRAVSDSTLAPGHPLPRTHPAPSLLAKLYLNVAQLYSAADGLLGSLTGAMSPSDSIKRYIADSSALALAMAHKWLGVDRGERDSAGEAVAWLLLAKDEIKTLLKRNKASLSNEADSIDSFLAAYRRLNDTVAFQPVPKIASLLAATPGGRAALSVKTYSLPTPAFDARSTPAIDVAALSTDDAQNDSDSDLDEASTSYAGQRSYY